jgi:hypothetical protein
VLVSAGGVLNTYAVKVSGWCPLHQLNYGGTVITPNPTAGMSKPDFSLKAVSFVSCRAMLSILLYYMVILPTDNEK